MAIEVFNRYEKKFIITDEIYKILKPMLEDDMETDSHSINGEFYNICNIYYDTEENDIIRKSLDNPIYKEKLRLRSYGVVGLDEKVYLEIKKKYNGLINKRRTSILLKDAYQFIEKKEKPELKPYMNGQVLNEIDYFLHQYQLKPTLYLTYDRNALFGKQDKNLRITFDTNIRTRRYDIALEKGNYGELLLPEGIWLMEIKTEETTPLWLVSILSKLKLYNSTFSKYGTEYRNYVLHKK